MWSYKYPLYVSHADGQYVYRTTLLKYWYISNGGAYILRAIITVNSAH